MTYLRAVVLASLLAACAPREAAGSWSSPLLGSDIGLQVFEPTVTRPASASGLPLVIYLLHLGSPRVGTDSDENILRDLRAEGFVVAVLDYRRAPAARMPGLARDLVALRQQLQKKTFLSGRALDSAQCFIVPSGHRLRRNVLFYGDPVRPLAMDLIYPSRPAGAVGAVLEFSCDNANRMGNYSLNFCTDTLLPGAAIEGLAVAMADHPVAAPYQGLDAMPESASKVQAAVRTLRAEGRALGLNDRIVTLGFSRGSGMALMAVTTAGRSEVERRGEHPDQSTRVQGAVVMSGRFTYLDLLPDDAMLPRYTRAWGDRASQREVWQKHGALDYLDATQSGPPLFLTINVSEGRDALHQMDVLRSRLQQLNYPFTYVPESEPRGHKMPISDAVLAPLYAYLHARLDTPSSSPFPSPLPP